MAAEIFLGPIVEKLLEKLISGPVRHVADLWKVTTQLGKMSKTLSEIQEVLDDAEAQQIMNSSIKEWLNKLKHVAYDLDENITKALFYTRHMGPEDDLKVAGFAHFSKAI